MNKKILTLTLVFGLSVFLVACKPKTSVNSDNKNAQPVEGVVPTLPAGLEVVDLVVGTGKEAKNQSRVSVHYTGTLTDGTKIDSSIDRNLPYQFVLGAGEVIRGWDLGVVGMKVGGKRVLTIAPELGYGSRVIPKIPANSTLIFEIELLSVDGS